MKRSRTDQISSCVQHYLRHRQYTSSGSDGGGKKERPVVCDLKELTMSCTVQSNDSSDETISYCSLSADPACYDQQFIKLKAFVSDCIEPYQCELRQLLYPVFAHFYLELVTNGHKTPAQKFFVRHQSMFTETEENNPLLAALVTTTARENIHQNRLVSEFSEKKYRVSLSEGSFQYFLKYLQHEDCLLFLQILNHHLHLSVRTDESSEQDPVQGQASDEGQVFSPAKPPGVHVNGVTETKPSIDANVGNLQRIIQRVEQGVPPLPSICLYSLYNCTSTGCSSLSLSGDDSILCAGFEDASLMLWPLTPQQPASKSSSLGSEVKVRVSQVHLAGDHPDDVQKKLSGTRSTFDIMSGASQQYCVSDEGTILRAHSAPVYATRFMHDHDILLSASADKTIRLWDISCCANVVCYKGHNYAVFDIDTSTTGSMFASCSYDQTAKLWSTDRIFPLRTFIGHTKGVNCVRFHPNGNYLATGSTDMTVRLWSLQDGQPMRLLQGHHGMVMSLAFSPNGKYLASAGEDKRVKLWDLATGSLLKDLSGHKDIVHSLAFNSQSTLLASGGLDACVNVWDIHQMSSTSSGATSAASNLVNTGSPELLASYNTKSNAVLCLKFSRRNFLQAAAS